MRLDHAGKMIDGVYPYVVRVNNIDIVTNSRSLTDKQIDEINKWLNDHYPDLELHEDYDVFMFNTYHFMDKDVAAHFKLTWA